MLPRSSKTSFSSNVPALEGVHPVQEYVADLQSKPVKSFPDIDEENEEENGNQEESQKITAEENDKTESDFLQLIPEKDFSELFQQFFVVEHKRLTLLQSKILLERDFNSDAFLTDRGIHETHILRQHLYDLQVHIFQSPKGQQYDTLW